jgi:hypothetical protein
MTLVELARWVAHLELHGTAKTLASHDVLLGHLTSRCAARRARPKMGHRLCRRVRHHREVSAQLLAASSSRTILRTSSCVTGCSVRPTWDFRASLIRV